MKRSLAAAVAASTVALGLAACDGGGHRVHDRDFDDDPCNSYSSCESCTPILGCGWCYKSDGTGACASSSIECESAPAFSWTWDPTGCHVGADAAVTAADGAPGPADAVPGSADGTPGPADAVSSVSESGSTAAEGGSSPADASSEARDATPASDAATSDLGDGAQPIPDLDAGTADSSAD
jgi:hypothetical protein